MGEVGHGAGAPGRLFAVGVLSLLMSALLFCEASAEKLKWALPDGQQGEMTTLGRAFAMDAPDFIAAAARIVLSGEVSTDEEMMKSSSKEFCAKHSKTLVGFLRSSNNPESNSVTYNHFMVALTWEISSFAFDQNRAVYRTVMTYPDCEVQKTDG